jgi:NADH-quinone oxidoreductase subunit A
MPKRLQARRQRQERIAVLAEYLPSLLFLIVATGIGITLMLVGRFLGPRRPDLEKLSPYECGFEAFEDARMKFDVRYYLIAIQFIVFDLEIIFIVPWTQVFMELGAVRSSPWACSSACCSSVSFTSGRRERWNGSDSDSMAS